jgi:voltage-dependent potassium channel beta subunit
LNQASTKGAFAMQYRRLGDAGMKVSAVSLGAWITYGGSVDDTTAVDCLRTAVEHGVNFIDTADAYERGEAEKVVGAFVKDYNRSDFVISSKCYWPMSDNINDRGLSRKHIFESVHKSLKRLGTDYLDIFFCHRHDAETPTEETVRAMDDLVHQGKVLYWGTSVWSAAQIESAVGTAQRLGAYAPKSEQPRYNMLDRHIEAEILPTCRKHGIGLVVWSPLAQGLLTGKYNDGIPADSRGVKGGKLEDWAEKTLTPENVERLKQLGAVAGDLGVTMGQLALAWCLRLPEISSVITGATRPQQVMDNVKAAEILLEEDVLAKIEEILA